MDREEEQQLCVKGCGFYGCPENLSMCSKCYRDHKKIKKQQEDQEEIAALMSRLHVKGGGSPTDPAVDDEATAARQAAAAVVPRCVRCNKKVSMYGFKCRCGCLFCARHRYPEEHGCTFDFKTEGRIALAKANVLIKPDKLDDRII